MNKETKGMLIGFIGILIFSLTLPVSKIAIQSFDPYFIAFGRAALAGLIALAYLVILREPMLTKADLPRFVVIALGVVFGFPILTTVAMAYGSSSHGAVILGMMPLATTVIGVVRFGERPSTGFWLVSLLGAALVATYALLKSSGSFTLVYLSLFPMFLGFFFWYEGLAVGGIARVSQVQLIQPFCTLFAANILLGEPLTWMNLIFAVLVVSTVILGKRMLVQRS